ncbi:MAG: hypothetical protein J5603_05425 [Bacteroidales bacterium]|nr:hypothetical protein [Bacteroidales bacterium]MBR5652053.1 hypothetical protein [Bacteroidales bacterium]
MPFNLFETRKPREFNLETRYYDPAKEQELKKKWEAEGNKEKLAELRRSRLEAQWSTKRRSADKSALNRKVLVFALLAAAILAFIMLFPSKDTTTESSTEPIESIE